MLPLECWPAEPDPLPGLAGEIEEVIGRRPTLELISSLSATGARPWRRVLYVPRRMPPGHALIRLVGPEVAERLRYWFGGEILQIPLLRALQDHHRIRSVLELAEEGWEPAAIAEALDLSLYRVREILRAGDDARGGEVRSR